MRLADLVVVAIMCVTGLALLACALVRVQDAAARVNRREQPARVLRQTELPADPLATMEDMLAKPQGDWRESERFLRKAGEK
jgi:hypothetical protein